MTVMVLFLLVLDIVMMMAVGEMLGIVVMMVVWSKEC